MTATIDVYSPIDGRLLKSYPVTPDAVIAERVKVCREGAKSWAALTVEQRLTCLAPLSDKLLADVDAIVDKLVEVTGKVRAEALLGEIYPLLDMLRYYRKQAARILAPRFVLTSPFAFADAEACYRYQPYGVVAVISPWNYPLQLTLYPLLSALIAGNGVVFKTSELSLPVGELIMDLLAGLDLPEGLVQWVIGGPSTGRQLIEQRPDLVFFTGGVNAGRAVMAAAAKHPVPVILELGGKDAMVVCADADVDRAVNAALYGGFCNSGQVCVSVERLYVEAGIFDVFVERLCQAASGLTVGHGEQGDLGAMSSKEQLAVVEALYRDAIAKGAQASGPLRKNGQYLYPLVLWNVTEDMRVMREEIFGPLLPVLPFANEQALFEQVNAGHFGLNASLWSRDVDKARKMAERLQVGNWIINDVLKNIGHPRLPFGGVKNSGFGRYHGAEGLRSFTYTVSGLVSGSRQVIEPNWFPYSEQRYRQLRAFIEVLFDRGPLMMRISRNWRELQAFRQYAGLHLSQHWRNLKIFLTGGRDS